jgi:DNA repair ATPase RecN
MEETKDRSQLLANSDRERHRLVAEVERYACQLAAAENNRRRLIAEGEEQAERLAAVEQRLGRIEASRTWRSISAIKRLFGERD